MTKRKANPTPEPTPLPPMCVFCQSVNKVQPVNDEWPAQNPCFETRSRYEAYAPFPRDKRTLWLTCDNFSHIKTAVLGLRGGGRMTVRATPEHPRVDMERLKGLFD